MPLRNGKKYLKNSFKLENQPFKYKKLVTRLLDLIRKCMNLSTG